MLVVEKMLEEEEEVQTKVNEDIEKDYFDAKKRVNMAKLKWNLV